MTTVSLDLPYSYRLKEVRDKQKIEHIKCHYKDEHLMQNMPSEEMFFDLWKMMFDLSQGNYEELSHLFDDWIVI